MTRSRELAELASAYDSGNSLGFRNRIINGDMRISQRGTSFSVGGSDVYTVDRWFAIAAGANVTATKVSYADGTAALALDGAASNTLADVGQRIESVNSYDLAGSVCTVTLAVFSNDARNVTWEVYYANSADVFSSKTLISSGTLTTVANTYTPHTFQFTAPSGAANGLEVRFKFGSLLAGKQVALSRVQLEAGTVATPFERRDYGRELQMCQRYGWRIANGGASRICMGGWDNSTSGNFMAPFPITMRATPTMTVVSTGTVLNLAISWHNITSLTLTSESNASQASLQFAVASSGASQGKVAIWGASAGSNPDAFFSAEL